MTRARLAAALAGIVTALLFQATLIAPVVVPWAVSLPAVLVAAVALVDGPATGMSFGFTIGLIADLGSEHPAGILALCWLGVGLVSGLVADRRSVRRDALTAGVVCGLGSIVTTALLVVAQSAGSVSDAVVGAAPTAAGDALIALALVPLVRRMLRTDSLRAPHPLFAEVALFPEVAGRIHRG